MTVRVPAHVPWLIHRVAISRRYTDSLREITDEWGLDELLDAHDVLDAFDDAEAGA